MKKPLHYSLFIFSVLYLATSCAPSYQTLGSKTFSRDDLTEEQLQDLDFIVSHSTVFDAGLDAGPLDLWPDPVVMRSDDDPDEIQATLDENNFYYEYDGNFIALENEILNNRLRFGGLLTIKNDSKELNPSLKIVDGESIKIKFYQWGSDEEYYRTGRQSVTVFPGTPAKYLGRWENKTNGYNTIYDFEVLGHRTLFVNLAPSKFSYDDLGMYPKKYVDASNEDLYKSDWDVYRAQGTNLRLLITEESYEKVFDEVLPNNHKSKKVRELQGYNQREFYSAYRKRTYKQLGWIIGPIIVVTAGVLAVAATQ